MARKPISLAASDTTRFMGNVLKLSVMQFQADLGSTAVSPRDTGRFRSNWFAQAGSASGKDTEATDQPQDDAKELLRDIRKPVHLTNNLDYAETITFGGTAVSKDPNWFRQYFSRQGQTVVDDAVKAAERLI